MPTGSSSPGARFHAAVAAEQPLQVVGTINAYCALLAERAGFRALYLSGAGVANASSGRPDDHFVIMAGTDAHATEGLAAAIDRSRAYVEAGADMIFAEALTTLDEYREFTSALGSTPVLGNITEFGKTPLFTVTDLQAA